MNIKTFLPCKPPHHPYATQNKDFAEVFLPVLFRSILFAVFILQIAVVFLFSVVAELCLSHRFAFLSFSFFIISRVAGFSAGPGRGDEVLFSGFPFCFLGLLFSDGVCLYNYARFFFLEKRV